MLVMHVEITIFTQGLVLQEPHNVPVNIMILATAHGDFIKCQGKAE